MEARHPRRALTLERQQQLAGEVELGGEHAAVPGLDAHVDVPRAAGVEPRHDGRELIASFRVGELVAPWPEPRIVVLAMVVCVPEVEQRPGERLAAPPENA